MKQYVNLNLLKQAVADRDEIKFNTLPNGCVIACYVVSMAETFATPLALECRGIVFNSAGNVISRPIHKFFNVGERPETLVTSLDWRSVARVMDKRDGSMIHTVELASELGDFDVKSKKSFESDVANKARALIKRSPELLEFCKCTIAANCTATFEYTAPDSRIVLYYPNEELTLLHVRNNSTGEYMRPSLLRLIAQEFGIKLVAERPELLEALKSDPYKLAEETEGIEGWIVQFEDGNMVKLKTKWYLERHRAMTFLRERDIALLTVNEDLDDLKALLVGEGAEIAEILAIEKAVVAHYNQLELSFQRSVSSVRGLDFKAAALQLQSASDPLFGLVMSELRGKEVSLKEHFIKNCIPSYSLRQVNVVQSVAEVD